MLLSVVIPVFNEEKTVRTILERIEEINLAGVKKQIIIVDDGSTDKTRSVLHEWMRAKSGEKAVCWAMFRHESNRGKGAAIQTALAAVKGEYTVIQDADLEYDPADWPKMLACFSDGRVSAVYGSRNLTAQSDSENRRGYRTYYWGGKLLTLIFNLLYGSSLTDINTGYKMFRTEFLKSLKLEGRGFEFCEEVTAKIIKRGGVIKEVPISYNPRTFKEGKKISARDGLIGLWTIIKTKF